MSVLKFVAKALRYVVGVVLVLFGLLGTLIGIVAIVDPVGTQMADDGNPFGTPPGFFESLVMTLIFLAIAGIGVLIVGYKQKGPGSSDV